MSWSSPDSALRTTGAVLLCLCAAMPGRAAPVINELLPDPEGSDGGREFVELFNPDPVDHPLAGVSLQFANGAEGAVWRNRWTGADGDTIGAGERFLITDRNWTGPPADAEAYLGLQNGPDAIRLTGPAGVLDLVGYGALTDTALYEGAPAPLRAGDSLSRRPDGADTDDNAADFVPATPTPGERNFRPRSLAPLEWSAEPPTLARAGAACEIEVRLVNDGTEALLPGQVQLSGLESEPLPVGEWKPGVVRTLAWRARAPLEGDLAVGVQLVRSGAPDTVGANLGRLQVGPASVVLNEVLAAPGQGQGEWIELFVPGPEPVELGRYRIRDEDGDWRPLPGGSVPPGGIAVLCQDSTALVGWLADTAAAGAPAACAAAEATFRSLGSWPSLNNSAPDERDFADRIRLARDDGSVIDHVDVGRADLPVDSDRSLEREAPRSTSPASGWAACTHPARATPGCPNSVSLPAASAPPGMLTVTPAVLDRAGGAGNVRLGFTVPPGADGWALRLFTLGGDRVRDLGGDRLGPGPRDVLWDGRDDSGAWLPPGGYLAAVEIRGAGGGVVAVHRVLIGVR